MSDLMSTNPGKDLIGLAGVRPHPSEVNSEGSGWVLKEQNSISKWRSSPMENGVIESRSRRTSSQIKKQVFNTELGTRRDFESERERDASLLLLHRETQAHEGRLEEETSGFSPREHVY